MAKKKVNKKKQQTGIQAGSVGGLALLLVLVVLLAVISPGKTGGGGTAEAFNTQVTAESPIRINEIMASNGSALTLADGSLPDWVELYNTGDADLSLEGFALMPANDPSQLYTFGKVSIPAGGYVIVFADGGVDIGVKELHAPFRIPASGDTLVLMNAVGRVVDRAETPALERNWVYARDYSGDWEISMTATPGKQNDITEPDGAGAAKLLAVTESAVTVTEVMSDNATYYADETGAYTDYVELYNRSEQPVSLKGWCLSDDRENIARWQFPDVTVPAGGYLVVHCSGNDTAGNAEHLHAGFRLGSEGTDVVLTRDDGKTAAMVEVPALQADQAYSFADGQWTSLFAPTPGMANTLESARSLTEQLRGSFGQNVYINEIGASATSVPYDWVEIYNAGGESVDLSGYGLSDNAGRPRKWQFPEGTTIGPGEHMGLLLSGLDTADMEGYLHVNFKLSMAGGYSLTLSRPNGAIVDRTFVPPQYNDVSYGRVSGLEGFYYYTTPTPLAQNGGAYYAAKASAPEYSVRGGMFKTGDVFDVELTSEPGSRIYYTLDNTDPTQYSTLYTGPIQVSGTTILRTRVYRDGYLESFMDTQSYLYDVNNGNGVYVVSLVSDPDNLSSEERGIMIKGPNALPNFPYGSMNKGANYWMDWEREAHVEVYGGDGEQLLSQECGIKIAGQYSRAEPQKGIKVIARSEYGSNRFPIKMFSERPYTEYQSFILRSAGQDTSGTRMRDSVLTALAKDTSVMYMETEICVLYIDGQYWGQYNLRERVNPESIAQFEGWVGDEDSIDLVKANTNVMHGSDGNYQEFLDWVEKADPTAADFYEKVNSVVDVRNYMEYIAIEMFVGNGDTLNVKRYRNLNDDGRWRWILFDLDNAFKIDTDSINRWLNPEGMGINLWTDNRLFVALMKNPQFRDEFLTYMGEQLATTFSTKNVLAMFEERYTILDPLLDDQLERWNSTRKKYNSELKKLISYAEERPMKLMMYFAGTKYLNLSTEEMYHYFGKAKEVAEAYAAGN